MNYRLYDAAGNLVTHHDLQDKGSWCVKGKSYEDVFVERFGSLTGLIINPAKKHDPYPPDLFNTRTNCLGDLKVQNTPFFQARDRFGLDPLYTVVFNLKDRRRYERLYPNVEIYFWVEWIAVKFETDYNAIEVSPMTGIWFIQFKDLLSILDRSSLHNYAQRVNDVKGNAKSSYVLSLQETAFKTVWKGQNIPQAVSAQRSPIMTPHTTEPVTSPAPKLSDFL